MIISSQGEACSPNDDIKALDLNGTNSLRYRLRQIQTNSDSGEAALLAEAEINLGVEQAEREQALIEEARQALQDFRDYLAQSSDQAAQALPGEEDLEYSYNPNTQKCEITHQDGQDIELDFTSSQLQGELPLPLQLIVTKLYCGDNQLTLLPELPDSLTVLSCHTNQLTALPELPASLVGISCSSNQLTTLPVLPDSLAWLYCDGNQLTTLPELPASLTWLDCSKNPGLASNPAARAALQAMRARRGTVKSW
jgi:Leucine-rich repeat (LRR) protein